MEYEFRAWENRKLKCYLYGKFGDEFPFKFKAKDGIPRAIIVTNENDYPEWTIEQYTNYKDINKVKLFAGDIVKDEHGHIGVIKHEIMKGGLPAMFISWDDGDITGFECAAHCDIEKIGTVRENPELLEE